MSVDNQTGFYRARIVLARCGEAKNSNKTPMVELHIELLGQYGRGEADVNELYSCRKPAFNPVISMYTTDATMGVYGQPGWVAEKLAMLGFSGNFRDLDKLAGIEIDVICDHEKFKDKERERWTFLRPVLQKKPQVQTLADVLTEKFGNVFGGAAGERSPAA